MRIIVFDTETTGLPSAHGGLEKQPHVCQFAAFVCDCDLSTGKFTEVTRLDQFVRPPVSIPMEASHVHGITDQRVMDEPSFGEVVHDITDLFNQSDVAVAHNIAFDEKILGFELQRLGLSTKFLPSQTFDTMIETKELCQLIGRGEGYKNPKLTELYQFLFGKSFHGAHDAMSDVLATAVCLKALFDRKIFQPTEPDQVTLF